MDLQLSILAEAFGFALAVLIAGWAIVAGWRLARSRGKLRIAAPEGINAAMAISGVLLISTAMWGSGGSVAPFFGGGAAASEPTIRGPGPSATALETPDAVESVTSTVRRGDVRLQGSPSLAAEEQLTRSTSSPGDDPAPQPAPGPGPDPAPGPGPEPSPSPAPEPQPEPSPSPSPEPEPSPSEEPSPSPSDVIDPCDLLPPPLICP